MSGNVPPPMAPPPPPPPMPPGGWAPPKPTSGKAIAALICGLSGPVAAFFCPVLGVAVLVGLVLGVIGIVETGKKGSRSGRGMAIAGTVVSALGLAGTIAIVGAFIAFRNFEDREQETRRAEHVAEDQELLTRRLQEYCEANGGSLGPGGPVLARDVPEQNEWDQAGQNAPVEGRVIGGTVETALEISHLAGENELHWLRRRGGSGWELTVTGQKTATLRARRWDGEIVREIEVRDAQRGLWVQTVP